MLLAARRDEDFDACGLSLHLRPAIAVLTGDPSLRRGPRLQATAASSAPRPFIYAFVSRPAIAMVAGDPRRRPRPLAPRRSPRSPAPASRPCIRSFVPHRGSVTPALPLPLRWDWGRVPPPPAAPRHRGLAPLRPLSPRVGHGKGGDRRRGEGWLRRGKKFAWGREGRQGWEVGEGEGGDAEGRRERAVK